MVSSARVEKSASNCTGRGVYIRLLRGELFQGELFHGNFLFRNWLAFFLTDWLV